MRNIICIFLLLFALAACRGEETAVVTSTNVQKEVAVTSYRPLDTAVLDVCTLLPAEAIIPIVGDLREAPEAAVVNGDERGCTYLTDEGFVYTVYLAPVDRWEIAKAVFQNPTAVPNLGDEAFLVEQSGDTNLYVLLKERTMMQVYNTTSDTAVSTKLAEFAINTINTLQ